MQYPQCFPDLHNPGLKHILTEGGGPRRQNPARVTGTSGGRGDREASQSLGKEEGFASIEVETNRGALCLDNAECSREVPRRADQGAIVEVPGVQGKSGNLSLDTLDDGVESQGKPQQAQRSPCCTPQQLRMEFVPRWRRGWHE